MSIQSFANDSLITIANEKKIQQFFFEILKTKVPEFLKNLHTGRLNIVFAKLTFMTLHEILFLIHCAGIFL